MKNIIICGFVILFAINLNATETPCSQYKKFFPELLKYNECMAKLKTEGKLQKKDGKSVEEIAKELNMTVDAVRAAMSKSVADEGYSKHPKGSKKYKQHMAAMHAAKG